jgi:hypothetical protein
VVLPGPAHRHRIGRAWSHRQAAGGRSHLITNISNSPVIDSGATAFDVCDAGSSSVTASNAVNLTFPGTYAITSRSTGVSAIGEDSEGRFEKSALGLFPQSSCNF